MIRRATRSADRACIVGVGATSQGTLTGRSGDDLAIWALRDALDDSGLTKLDIDGLLVQRSYANQGDIEEVGHRLGLEPRVGMSIGHHCEGLLLGTALIESGMCRVVAAIYGTNQKSNRNPFSGSPYKDDGNYDAVYGFSNPGAVAALNYRRRMHDFGATEEQLGAVAVAQSHAAALNPLAVYRSPLTIADYLATRYVIAPLRLVDFSMVSDGGFALIMARGDVAASTQRPPVRLLGAGLAASFLDLQHPDAMYHPSQTRNAEMLWSECDCSPDDVDVLYVQDAYTPNVLSALENYRFCEFGTAHEWIQNGRIELDGQLPVNPNGGQNRMTYMVGWQNTFDAVKQLRGEAQESHRQVSDASTILCTFSSGHWRRTWSVLYSRENDI